MKVLVIQIKMIGDVLASTVICEAIKKQHPDWEVHYMIQPNTLAVVENNPYIDKIIFFDAEKHKGFINLYRLGKTLKKENYSVILDAYGKWESILPAFFSGAKARIGNKKWYTRLFYTKTITYPKSTGFSAINDRLYLAKTILETSPQFALPKIYLTEDEVNSAKSAMQSRLNPDCKTIMISVLGSNQQKSLPAPQMAATLDDIATRPNVELLFNFMPNQEEEAKAIYDLCKPETRAKIVFDFYTKGLRTFLAVLSQCDALIGNEGGAVNMAKALNIPTFTIFSPWINKLSWSIENDTTHVAVHLNDYFPEIYKGVHPKKFKKKAFELYTKLRPELYNEALTAFLKTV